MAPPPLPPAAQRAEPQATEPAGEVEPAETEPSTPLPAPAHPDRKLVKRGLWRGKDIRVYDDGTVELMTDDGWQAFSSIRAMHQEIDN